MNLQLEELGVLLVFLGQFSGEPLLMCTEYYLWYSPNYKSTEIFSLFCSIAYHCEYFDLEWNIALFFRWGGGKDDKYFARIGKNVVSVYETETFTLIDKKSMKVENVMDFSWSPTDPILSLFVPELGGGNQPARVSPEVPLVHN